MALKLLAAACHVSPITLSAHKTTQKCISFIDKAAKNSANLVVFPESYIPAFPVWSALLAPTQNHHFFEAMAKESVYIDDEEIRSIRQTAKLNKIIVSLGISEKVRYSTATLFNSNIIIGTDGEILVHHRKLMPTFFEKLTWSPGDGQGLRIADTQFGKIGASFVGRIRIPWRGTRSWLKGSRFIFLLGQLYGRQVSRIFQNNKGLNEREMYRQRSLR
jgi:predicted amidohydrolase